MKNVKEKIFIPDGKQGRPEGLDGLLQGFFSKELQSAVQIFHILDKHGYTIQSFEEWVKKQVLAMAFVNKKPTLDRLKSTIEKYGITEQELETAIIYIKQKRIKRTRMIFPKCPECGVRVEVYPINDRPDMMYKDVKYKTWLICPNCDWEMVSEKSIEEEIKLQR